MESKIKGRRKVGAVCPKCKSPDYIYTGLSEFGKHEFKCNSCYRTWQYGKSESKYTIYK